VGQLASGVAHEINNPLQTVVGLSELCLAAEDRAAVRADLARILSEARRAGRIVSNLLSFVRRSPSERALESLNGIAQSSVALRAYGLRVANIRVEENYGPQLPPVAVSREAIQQIVLNLILNAEQALMTARRASVLRIRTGRTEDHVYVEVADDGPGVDPTLAGRIFEPFFTTKVVGEGTGLGLSIAHGIAAAHGGRLELMPSARGACFRLTLPAALAAAVPEGGVDERPVRRQPGGAPKRALVVDDEPAVRELLRRLLRRRDVEADLAPDGEAALVLAERGSYDLVLCDARMPRLNGPQLYRRFGERRPDLQRVVVFISGDVASGDIAELSRRCGVPLLPKPFTAAELDAVLEEILSPAVA
jgi:CheY-like chemotaxis protein